MNDTIHRLTERPLVWDTALLTDGLSPAAVQTVTAVRPARPDRVQVIIDHDTPAGSVAAAEHQANLQRFARENGLSFTCGRGVGYHLLAQQGLAAPGKVVIGCGRHMAAVGAAGALGLSLSPEDMARALETGTVSFCGRQRNISWSGDQQVYNLWLNHAEGDRGVLDAAFSLRSDGLLYTPLYLRDLSFGYACYQLKGCDLAAAVKQLNALLALPPA